MCFLTLDWMRKLKNTFCLLYKGEKNEAQNINDSKNLARGL
jgi:hypothetical protein